MVFQLTPQELLILLLSEKGYSIKEIAEILDVDEDMLQDVIQDLIERGYVVPKKRWKLFGSETYLEVTAEGKKSLAELARILKDVIDSIRGMVEKGNYDGARALISKYVEYLPYAPLLGVAEASFIENLMKKMGFVPSYAPPKELYSSEEEEEWEI